MRKPVCAVIVCAGAGRRMESETPKQFLDLAGKPVLERTLEVFEEAESVKDIVLVTFAGDTRAETIARKVLRTKRFSVVPGGKSRQDSVLKGLMAVPAGYEYVLIHDGVRPLIKKEMIERTVSAARNGTGIAAGIAERIAEGAIVAVAARDTPKTVDENAFITGTTDRSTIRLAQTPQVFRLETLIAAHQKARADGFCATDDSELVERLGKKVLIVPGDDENIKITTPTDLLTALAILQSRKKKPSKAPEVCRTGIGYDAHRFTSASPTPGFVVLGGHKIPYERGLIGHSDADVLSHAVMDAVLGASGGPDIGALFPDTDPRYRGACSLKLAACVRAHVERKGFFVRGIDCTVLAEGPRISAHRGMIEANLAEAFGLDTESVSVKASTNEGMGFVGRKEGIAVLATAVLFRGDDR